MKADAPKIQIKNKSNKTRNPKAKREIKYKVEKTKYKPEITFRMQMKVKRMKQGRATQETHGQHGDPARSERIPLALMIIILYLTSLALFNILKDASQTNQQNENNSYTQGASCYQDTGAHRKEC